MATVNIKSVSMQYEENSNVLTDVNLEIDKGEFVAIVGPSGCGKSTLLRLIAGLEELSSGSILINDKCVNKTPASERDMAMVFQNYALYPHMTVFNNMAYGLKMRKVPKQDIKKRVEETAELLKIGSLLQRMPAALSGGQKQRVAMGRAIVRAPSVFLFDEPLSNLDASLRTDMRHEIKRLHSKLKITSIYVTHDQTEAMTLADRIVILNKGLVEQVGTPYELYYNPNSRFVAGFTGHYPINFISATINIKKGIVDFENGKSMKLPDFESDVLDGQKIQVGIRAEHCYLADNDNAFLKMSIDFIDVLGADKLVHGNINGAYSFVARLQEGVIIESNILPIGFHANKAIIFCDKSGRRLGRWNDENASIKAC